MFDLKSASCVNFSYTASSVINNFGMHDLLPAGFIDFYCGYNAHSVAVLLNLTGVWHFVLQDITQQAAAAIMKGGNIAAPQVAVSVS